MLRQTLIHYFHKLNSLKTFGNIKKIKLLTNENLLNQLNQIIHINIYNLTSNINKTHKSSVING